jgi:hypothetical protein
MPAGFARPGSEAQHVAAADVAEHVEEPRPEIVRSRGVEETPAGGPGDVPQEGLGALSSADRPSARQRTLNTRKYW